jgi:hypothetical protein
MYSSVLSNEHEPGPVVLETVNSRTQIIIVVQHSQMEAGSSILQGKNNNDLPRLTFGYHERWA